MVFPDPWAFVFQLHEVYSRLCAQRQVSGVGQGECLSLCSLLESRGIVALKKAKEARLTKVPDEEMLCSAGFDLCCLKMKLEGLSGNKTPSETWLIKASVSAGVPEDRGERCRKRSEGSNAAGQHPRCRTPLVIL